MVDGGWVRGIEAGVGYFWGYGQGGMLEREWCGKVIVRVV
jgi:hypothetical protein